MSVIEGLLPLGSVVMLRDGSKRVMIYGRKQQQLETGTMWDYIACLYPEGHIDDEYTYLFNHEQVERVYFVGYQDEEELEFAAANLATIDEPNDGLDAME